MVWANVFRQIQRKHGRRTEPEVSLTRSWRHVGLEVERELPLRPLTLVVVDIEMSEHNLHSATP